MENRDPKDVLVKTGVQSADNPFKFIMSSEAEDRMGDVIRQDGWQLDRFKQNPIALFGHSHGFPIGTWKNVKIEANKLVGELVMAAQGTSTRIDEIRSLLEQRVLRAVSVGFTIKKYSPMDPKDPWGAWDIMEAELLETSVVSVPANQEALATAKSLGVSKSTLALLRAGMTATPIQDTAPVATEVSIKDYSELLGVPSHELRRR